MARETFEHLIIIGRPAAGKSEVIDYLKKTPVAERKTRFHVGEFEEIDDFVFVWECFEIDDIWVAGYGMDHAGLWRSLPYIGAVDDC